MFDVKADGRQQETLAGSLLRRIGPGWELWELGAIPAFDAAYSKNLSRCLLKISTQWVSCPSLRGATTHKKSSVANVYLTRFDFNRGKECGMAKTPVELREQMLKELREKQAKGTQAESSKNAADTSAAAASSEEVRPAAKSSTPGTLANPQGLPTTNEPKIAEISPARRFVTKLLLGVCATVLVLILVEKIFRKESDPWERVPVYGTITVTPPMGEKLKGSVILIPTGPEGGPAAKTEFSSNYYAFRSTDGPVPGPHKVIVQVQAGADSEGRGQFKDLSATVQIPSTKPFEVNLRLSPPSTRENDSRGRTLGDSGRSLQ